MNLTIARTLKPGTRVLTKEGFGLIETIDFDRTHLITGGTPLKTAAALKLTLHGGKVYWVHPGDEIYSDQ